MEDIKILEKRAIDAFLAGDYVNSRDTCYRLVKLSPDDPRYYIHLAECHKRLGDVRLEQICRARAQVLSSQTSTRVRVCASCGLPVSEQSAFCGGCGARIPAEPAYSQPVPAPVSLEPAFAPPPPITPRYVAPVSPRPGGAKNAIIAILAAALLVLGAFFGVYANNLNQANQRIEKLGASVTSLTTHLNAEKATVADLTTQLATAQAQVTSLTANLVTANAKVTSLTSDLATANAKVTSTQASLDKATADLAAAVLANTSQAAEIKKVEDPRQFGTMTELTNWLAKDDTNTNPAYASLSSYSRAFILQVKALRDGYLLPACLDWDTTYIYSWNAAVVGGVVVSVNAATDAVTSGPTFGSPPPSHPLPLP